VIPGPPRHETRVGTRRWRPGIVALLLLLAPPLASAARADWFIMPFAGLKFGADTDIVDPDQAIGNKKPVYGVTVALVTNGLFGVEADVGYIPGFFEADRNPPQVSSSSVFTGMGNAVISVPKRWTGYSLRPYVSGGLGIIKVQKEDVLDVVPVNRNLVGWNVGGGAIGELNDRVGVRWDLRYFRTVQRTSEDTSISFGSERLSFWRGSIAFLIRP
jgi:Outer membrane protein beta-barrel domain